MEVTLFATCLVENFFPRVGESMVGLLEALGHRVLFRANEPCCGQMAYNTGHRGVARTMARRFLEHFSGEGIIVTPSGSCASMIRNHYVRLFRNDPALFAACESLAGRVFELSEFLVAFDDPGKMRGRLDARVYYHASCHLTRELGVVEQPRILLQKLEGIELCQGPEQSRCCGFGGTFSLKFPEISQAMMDSKIDAIAALDAEILTAADMGCLMHLWGGLRRRKQPLSVVHLAELLAGRVGESSLP